MLRLARTNNGQEIVIDTVNKKFASVPNDVVTVDVINRDGFLIDFYDFETGESIKFDWKDSIEEIFSSRDAE